MPEIAEILSEYENVLEDESKKFLLEEDDMLDEFNIEHRNFLELELPFVLEKIIDLRNKHAHIKAMLLEKFEELWNTLFLKND